MSKAALTSSCTSLSSSAPIITEDDDLSEDSEEEVTLGGGGGIAGYIVPMYKLTSIEAAASATLVALREALGSKSPSSSLRRALETLTALLSDVEEIRTGEIVTQPSSSLPHPPIQHPRSHPATVAAPRFFKPLPLPPRPTRPAPLPPSSLRGPPTTTTTTTSSSYPKRSPGISSSCGESTPTKSVPGQRQNPSPLASASSVPRGHQPISPQDEAKRAALSDPCSLESALFHETNIMRNHPAKYAGLIKILIESMCNNTAYMPGHPPMFYTEGKKVLRECISDLEAAGSRLPPLSYSTALSLACRDHVNDIGLHGLNGHIGTDGSTIEMRISRHGKWGLLVGECIEYGFFTAQSILLHLLVDDDVPGRGHRHTLLNPVYTRVGIGVGTHTKHSILTVMDFAGSMTSEDVASNLPSPTLLAKWADPVIETSKGWEPLSPTEFLEVVGHKQERVKRPSPHTVERRVKEGKLTLTLLSHPTVTSITYSPVANKPYTPLKITARAKDGFGIIAKLYALVGTREVEAGDPDHPCAIAQLCCCTSECSGQHFEILTYCPARGSYVLSLLVGKQHLVCVHNYSIDCSFDAAADMKLPRLYSVDMPFVVVSPLCNPLQANRPYIFAVKCQKGKKVMIRTGGQSYVLPAKPGADGVWWHTAKVVVVGRTSVMLSSPEPDTFLTYAIYDFVC